MSWRTLRISKQTSDKVTLTFRQMNHDAKHFRYERTILLVSNKKTSYEACNNRLMFTSAALYFLSGSFLIGSESHRTSLAFCLTTVWLIRSQATSDAGCHSVFIHFPIMPGGTVNYKEKTLNLNSKIPEKKNNAWVLDAIYKTAM